MIISIIGGTDGLGKWFARFLKNKGFDVVVTGRDTIKGKKVEKEIGVRYTNNNIEASKIGDIVMVAVPINITEKVIKEIAPYVRENCVLMDITSIKEIPARAMERYAKDGVCVIPTHPMFGPSTPSLKRQVVILTPSEKHKNNPWFDKIKMFLEKEGARVIVIPPEKHDRIMGVVQGLTHYAYIALGATLKDLNINIKESRKYASPIYELMLNIIARIIGQNPYLYADIQMHNPQIKHIHETFIKECNTIKQIVEKKDRESFAEIMKEAAKHFGNETIRGMNYSNKAVGAITEEIERIKKSIGKEIGLRHVYSNKVHFGIVKNVVDDFIILNKNGKDLKLNIANVMLMSNEELKEWKEQNLKKYYYDISILFKKEINLDIILKLLNCMFDIEIIDIYEGSNVKNGFKSVTFRIYSYKKDDLKILKKSFLEVIKNIGGINRYN
ncbi:prephenate dehydrogenase [Methanothermococcus okinawensis]|uniref:Chorismate mutase n=1 Tax=Methanothermococcus okinawensis (strain DSM 14208 / JCM 11175 / IH1) TaxID=647113 RepID=F8ALE9_METOI|nr:prephenate dehydrogenase [Methanothermococcus okinawensis]AEH06537.1 Chorismate mutase [Methanothermococcus okinawensis IH1]